MQTHEILDRLELLYPTSSKLADLRRAYVDKDLNSIFRIVTDDNKDDLRKALLQDNVWSLFRAVKQIKDTPFIEGIRKLQKNENFDTDCISRGQIKSKQWLVAELKNLNLDLGVVFLCAGWYATLATMMFENNLKIEKFRSFDIDDTCREVAEAFNKDWVLDGWKFKSCTKDIKEINYENAVYTVLRANGTTVDLGDIPNTIINTSCEHIKNFSEWYDLIPAGKLVILQSNDFYEVEEHVNCTTSMHDFAGMAPMTTLLYEGELNLDKYTRYMRIGYK
jgi:hypothetical protein